MMEAYEETGGNVIAVEEVPMDEVSNYGVVARGKGPDEGFAITGMVEKPKKEATRPPTSSSRAATSCSRKSSR